MVDNSEVVVVGKLRPQNAGTYINYGNGRYGYRSSEPDMSPTKRPADAQAGDIVVIANVSNPENQAGVNAAALNVAFTVAKLGPIIDGLADGSTYRVKCGVEAEESITGKELKAIWAKMVFVVSDKSHGVNRAGAITVVNGVNVDTLDFRSFQGPGSYADPNYQNNQGMDFIILHEVFHLTVAAEIYYDKMWNSFLEVAPKPATETKWYNNVYGWFGKNEKFVNTAVRNFQNSIGLNPLPAPNFNYCN